jgi:hypothetical protein
VNETRPQPITVRPGDIHYWRGQVWPRRRQLLTDRTLILAICGGALLTALAWHQPLGKAKISDLAGAELAFASISFGACVTGAVLALTLSPRDRISEWAGIVLPGKRFSIYSDLMFVFTWSAVSQLGVIVAAGLGFFLGGDGSIGPSRPRWSHIALLSLNCTIIIYALAQLFTIIATISQLAVVLTVEKTRQKGGPT